MCKRVHEGCKDHCSIKSFGKQPLSKIESQVPCLRQETINNIEKFVFFIGYARSGHSIIGSMMDAHPNMMIANEYGVFHKLTINQTSWDKASIFDELYRRSYCDATCGWRSSAVDFKGYTLSLNAQGRYTTLKVIGDKSGGRTSKHYAHFPSDFTEMYKKLLQTLNVPIRVVHVVRNPFDMISSRVLYAERVHDQFATGEISTTNKYDGRSKMAWTNTVFEEVKAVDDMIKTVNLTVLEIHSADFIRDPKHTLRSICTFLDLQCPEDYLQACYDKTYRSESRTRDVLVWDEQEIEDIESEMKQYTFLRRYSFHSD